MKLIVRNNNPRQNGNQFVKVHPSTILRLRSEALRERIADVPCIKHGWDLCNEDENNIQFLPMLVKFLSESEILSVYCSYNGGLCKREKEIDLPSSFLNATGIEPGSMVTVQALTFIKNASTIHIEPLSTANWELMEVYAQELEDGIMLSQISVVYPGQVFSLALGTDTVHVRVKEEGFLSDASYDPGLDMCLRLVADTEVIVSPKSRHDLSRDEETPFPQSTPVKILPTELDFSPDMKHLQELGDEGKLLLPSPPPFTAWMNPESLGNIPGWNDMSRCEPGSSLVPTAHALIRKKLRSGISDDRRCDADLSVAIVQLIESDIVPIDSIVIHSDIILQIGASPLYDLVSITVLTGKDVQHRIEAFSDAQSLFAKLLPVTFTPRNGIFQPSWTHPKDCKSFTTRSPVTTSVFDMNTSTMLVHGSFVAAPTEDGGVMMYKINVERTESKERKNNKLLSPTTDGNEDFSTYLFRAKDIPKLTFSDSPTEHPSSFQRDMLNTLPASAFLSRDYLMSVQKVEDQIRRQNCDYDVNTLKHLLLYGEKGIGKTYFIVTLAARVRLGRFPYSTFYLDCHQLQSTLTKMEDMLHELTRIFMEAVDLQPSLLLLDSLDLLVPDTGSYPNGSEDNVQQQQRNPMLINQTKTLADHLKFLITSTNQSRVVIICTCDDEKKLHKSLCSVDTFASKIEVPCLHQFDRFQLFKKTILQHGSRIESDQMDSKQFTKQTEGFLPRDLKTVALKVAMKHQIRALQNSNGSLISRDIESILSHYVPLAQQALNLEHSQTHTQFSDIGGLFEAKMALASVILKPMKYNFVYKYSPITLPRGLLLYGFPGCGKSYIVPALAQECGFNLVTCRGPELLDKYIGASEAKVRTLFEKAYAAAPSILFLDEFDALAPRRGSDNTGVTDRVVNQLLTFLDGVEDHGGNDGKIVYIIAASSRPDKIDPALVRPGRLERHIFLGYPTGDREFNDLLLKISKKRELDDELSRMIKDESFYPLLYAQQCQFLNLSAADINGVFDTAHLSAVHEFLRHARQVDSRKDKTVLITCDHLIEAFTSARPSLSATDRQMFSEKFAPFLGVNDHKASPDIIQTQLTALK